MANKITIKPNGPIIIQGELRLEDADGSTLNEDSELYLCRCGHSKNTPYCDGSHKETGFKDTGEFQDDKVEEPEGNGKLVISIRSNAMLIAKGPVTITNTTSTSITTRNKVALCRCGHSGKKPFCDASHKRCGFNDSG